jgi:hypothetical protein
VIDDLEIREMSFPPDTATRLAMLRVETRLRMSDCCVLLAAEVHTAAVASFDENLLWFAEQRDLTIYRSF